MWKNVEKSRNISEKLEKIEKKLIDGWEHNKERYGKMSKKLIFSAIKAGMRSVILEHFNSEIRV